MRSGGNWAMIRNMRIPLLLVLAIALLALVACSRSESGDESIGFAESAAAAPAFDSAVSIEREVVKEVAKGLSARAAPRAPAPRVTAGSRGSTPLPAGPSPGPRWRRRTAPSIPRTPGRGWADG